MPDVKALDEAAQESDLILGKPRRFWAARRTAVLLGVLFGVPGGMIGTVLLLWAAGPDHWSRGSWFVFGTGFTVVWTFNSIVLSLFLWWINHGIKRKH